MGYVALYRKYRPSKFKDVIGQDIIVITLLNSIITQNINHAYLFSGPRGTGKTSVAKIFAKTVNCLNIKSGERCENCEVCKAINENDVDIIEIDAASNNGVDEIREIRNNVKLVPTVGKYKVYIIDEVHMLSIGAFNALLKTLEEPPSHVIFILATTEIQKIPLTILSRCQRFDFKKVNKVNVITLLKRILKQENLSMSNDVLETIADTSEGCLRDAINLMDQLLSYSEKNIEIEDVYNLTGQIQEFYIKQMFDYILQKDIASSLNIINELYNKGKNLFLLVEKLSLLVRDINVNNNVNNYFDKIRASQLEDYKTLSNEMCLYISKELLNLSSIMKKSNNQKLLLEIGILDIIENMHSDDSETKMFKKSSDLIKKEEKISKNNTEEDQIISREIISIRINNALARASKNILKENQTKLLNLDIYLANKNYNKIVNILSKGNLVVASTDNFVFSYQTELDVNIFNKNIDSIETFFKKKFEVNVKIIAISNDEWNNIKKEYINNLKNGVKYNVQKEPKKDSGKANEPKEIVESIFGKEKINLK